MPGGITTDSLNAASKSVYFSLNSGVSFFGPGDLSRLDVNSTTIAEYLRSSAILMQALKRTQDNLNKSGHDITYDSLLAALASDLGDGELDGTGADNADARVAALMTVATTLAAIEAVTHSLEVDGTDAIERFDTVISPLYPDGPNPGFPELVASDVFLQQVRSTQWRRRRLRCRLESRCPTSIWGLFVRACCQRNWQKFSAKTI
jgi:hypothetical protein